MCNQDDVKFECMTHTCIQAPGSCLNFIIMWGVLASAIYTQYLTLYVLAGVFYFTSSLMTRYIHNILLAPYTYENMYTGIEALPKIEVLCQHGGCIETYPSTGVITAATGHIQLPGEYDPGCFATHYERLYFTAIITVEWFHTDSDSLQCLKEQMSRTTGAIVETKQKTTYTRQVRPNQPWVYICCIWLATLLGFGWIAMEWFYRKCATVNINIKQNITFR